MLLFGKCNTHNIPNSAFAAYSEINAVKLTHDNHSITREAEELREYIEILLEKHYDFMRSMRLQLAKKSACIEQLVNQSHVINESDATRVKYSGFNIQKPLGF